VTRVVLLLAAAVALAGCGGDDDAATDTTGHEGEAVVVYFLRDGQVWPVEREIHTGDAIDALYDGPTDEEASELELTTELPEDEEVSGATVAGSVATVEAVPADLSNGALAQIVYTLTRDGAVRSVDVRGKSYTRADFEGQTPSVLVESPLAFGDVSSPLTARGTANTFEATFSFEILDEGGEVIAGDFVTATSGTGTRGTFRFEQPFVVEEEQDGTLVVFELSAEDGSRMNEVEIPVTLLP
jgi:Immunoglobulin-like domain of bacterial spore germination/Sporulation and spore germination